MEILAVEFLVYLHFWYCRQTDTINEIGSWDWWKFKLLIWYISVRLSNETRTNVIVQAGMQANQFASAIDCAGNMAIFTTRLKRDLSLNFSVCHKKSKIMNWTKRSILFM